MMAMDASRAPSVTRADDVLDGRATNTLRDMRSEDPEAREIDALLRQLGVR